jgi:hypothetical protein
LLKAATLYPEEFVEGDVVVKFKKSYSHKVYISVPIGDEIHEFTFTK